jgi:autotransporter-associated beta strand protein
MLVLVGLGSDRAWAVSDRFVGTDYGNWNVSSNWNWGGVPDQWATVGWGSYTARIVLVDDTRQAEGLFLAADPGSSGKVHVRGGSLTVTEAVQLGVNGTGLVEIEGGTFTSMGLTNWGFGTNGYGSDEAVGTYYVHHSGHLNLMANVQFWRDAHPAAYLYADTNTGGTGSENSCVSLGSDVTVEVSRLEVGKYVSSNGVFTLSNTNRVRTDELIVGNIGTGTFWQNGGYLNGVTNVATGPSFRIGYMASGNGSYILNGGTLASADLDLATSGRGSFCQNSGYWYSGDIRMAEMPGSVATLEFNSGYFHAWNSITHGSGTATVIFDGDHAITWRGGGTKVFSATECFVGKKPGSSGYLPLSSVDSFEVAGALSLGERGSGTIIQSKGRCLAGTLKFGELGGAGAYILEWGTLEVGSVTQGTGAGTLSIRGGEFLSRGGINVDSFFVGGGSGVTLAGSLTTDTTVVGHTGAGTLALGSQNAAAALFRLTNGTMTGSGAGMTISSACLVENGTISARLGGSAYLLKQTVGTVTLSGANSYSGPTTVRAGTLIAKGDSSPGANGVFGNATTDIQVGDELSGSDVISLLIGYGRTISRGLTVNPYGGLVTLGGSNPAYTTATFSGPIALNRDVSLCSQNSDATVQFGVISGAGKTARLTGGGHVKVLPSSGTTNVNYVVEAGTGGRLLGGANTSGTVQYTGNITLFKEVTLSAASGGVVEFGTGGWSTHGYPVTVVGPGGVVQISNTLNTSGAVNVESGSLRVNGSLGGGGSALMVAGPASLGGTGTISKPVVVYGTINPGASPGVLTVNSDLTLAGTSTFDLGERGLVDPGAVDYDRIVMGGSGNTLTFGGTLNVVKYGNGPIFAPGQVYGLFDWGSDSTQGVFDAVNVPRLPAGLQWKRFGGQPFDYATGQIVVEESTQVAHYGLSVGLATSPWLLLNGNVNLLSSIANTGTPPQDTLDFGGLGALCDTVGGEISGPTTGGTDLPCDSSGTNTGQVFRGTVYSDGLQIVPAVAWAVCHNRPDDAIRDWQSPVVVHVGKASAGSGNDRAAFGPAMMGQGQPSRPGRDYAGLASKTMASPWHQDGRTLGTEAIIREGRDTSGLHTVSMEWRQRWDDGQILETAFLTSDVVRLTGMDTDTGGTAWPEDRHPSDPFVLEMTYTDPGRSGEEHSLLYLNLGDDHGLGGIGSAADCWKLATEGIFGGALQDGLHTSWDEFRKGHPEPLAELVGYWGWLEDGPDSGRAWAVIDFNNPQLSTPEPATLSLLALGGLMTLRCRRRK